MLGLTSRKYFCSLLSNKLTFLFFKRPAKEVNCLSKNKQIFDIYNFKIALKRVRLIRKVISSCFAAYGIIFLARKSNNLSFRRAVMFLFVESMEYIFCVSPMICQRVSVPMTIEYFHDKNSLVFVVFLHFFTVFCVSSLPFLSFVKYFNQIPNQRKQLRMYFLNFIVLFCPFFFCFQSVFSPLFSRCFCLHYIIICIQKLR